MKAMSDVTPTSIPPSDSSADSSSGESSSMGGPELPDHLLKKLRIEIPGYKIVAKIASGGQATVYRARELTSGLTVAIKVLNGGPLADPAARQRLQRETAALRALNHPNIVCVIESGRTTAGLDYLVMNYVEGRPLDALWQDAKFAAAVAPEPPARLRLFKRICEIVQAAHLKGITHRDLSPSNILISADGEPHVLDFGLASTAFNDVLTPAAKNLTITGQFIGKVKYAAPEQARAQGDAVDIRTDVYALGIILYQILTNGAFPYEVVGNLADVLHHIVHTRPLPPSSAIAALREVQDRQARDGSAGLRSEPQLVNETIEAVVLKALEKDPANRYQSAGDLAAEIDAYLAGRPTRSQPRRVVVKKNTGLRRLFLAAAVVLFTLGVIMNFRVIATWLGLSALVTSVAPGGSTSGAAPQLTPHENEMLEELADAEANIQTINKALRQIGYNVGQDYDRIDVNQNDKIHRDYIGGGPVRWDEFYGKTAKEYGSNGWGDHRPDQFAFIDQANSERIAQAKDRIASALQNKDELLNLRRHHESEQLRLWILLAFDNVSKLEVTDNDLFTGKLQGATDEQTARADLLSAYIVFLRTADRAAGDGAEALKASDANPDTVADALAGYMDGAYKTLRDSYRRVKDEPGFSPDDLATGDQLKGLCDNLRQECENITENCDKARERDAANEDQSKLTFRGRLQESLANFSADTVALKNLIETTAGQWKLKGQSGGGNDDAIAKFVLADASGGTQDHTGGNSIQIDPVGASISAYMPAQSRWSGTYRFADGTTSPVTLSVTDVTDGRATTEIQNSKGIFKMVFLVKGGRIVMLSCESVDGPSTFSNIDMSSDLPAGGGKPSLRITGSWVVTWGDGSVHPSSPAIELQREDVPASGVSSGKAGQ
jgi:serine/threonine protein kinase